MTDPEQMPVEERDPLALAMLAAWVNVPSPDALPRTLRAMADPHTMASWRRVAEAARAYFEQERADRTPDASAQPRPVIYAGRKATIVPSARTAPAPAPAALNRPAHGGYPDRTL